MANVSLDFTSFPSDESETFISIKGVLALLQGLDVSKSGGPDKLTGKMLKSFAEYIAESLTKIFRYSLCTGKLPMIWKIAQVTPIFKKGSRSQPGNYRPVSLTCIVCKLLEHVIAGRIHSFLDKHDILVSAQHGFRRDRSCETQLVYTFNDLAMNREKGLVTDVIILDFSKAFDSVNHRKLMLKLQCIGINSQVVASIKQFFSDRKQAVVVNGQESEYCPVLSGVPQGSVLGPLLFLLYINDLPRNISSECRLFADDALLYNVRENRNTLQEDLDKLQKWASIWQLSFNATKCSVLSVGETNSTQEFFLNNIKLKNVNHHPYLGVELSSDLKFHQHFENMSSKASRLLGMLSRVLSSADTKTRKVAYDTIVRPVVEYGCQAWDPYLKKDIKKLERIQNRALRFIFKIKGKVSFAKLRSDTSIPSLSERRRDLRHKLFFKAKSNGVLKDTHNSAPKQRYHTRQPKDLFTPSIKTNALFHSFWPRTIREVRELVVK
jgi:hypothetical protein